jgi:hypothetical protein
MKYIILSLTLLFISLPAHALMLADPSSKKIAFTVDTCTILISYGSYASGINTKLRNDINKIVHNNKNISDVKISNWGKEGESTTCLIISNKEYAQHLYNQIKNIIPEVSKRSWTAIDMKGKTPYQTKRPMK